MLMSSAATVFDVQAIATVAQELEQNKKITFETCDDALNQARQTLEETQNEEQTSKAMLDVAKGIEMAKHAIVIELEVRLAAAIAEMAAVTPDPIAMAAVGAKIADIESQLAPARQEYEEAVRHREALERRYEMAVKCVNLAQERLENLAFVLRAMIHKNTSYILHKAYKLNISDKYQYPGRPGDSRKRLLFPGRCRGRSY